MNLLTKAITLCGALALSFSLTGCGATGHVGGGGHIPDPIGGSGGWDFGFFIGNDGEMYYYAEDGRKICVEMVWSNSAGETIGEPVDMEIPGSGQVPAGAVRWEINEVECPDEDEDGDGDGDGDGGGSMWTPQSSQTVQADRKPVKLYENFIMGGPTIPMRGQRNVTYAFTIAGTRDAARAISASIVENGPGVAIGWKVDVHYFVEMIPEHDGLGNELGATLRWCDQGDDIETLIFDFNGYYYAELGVTTNLLHYDLPGDWNVVETFIPIDEFELPGSTYWWNNEGQAWWTTDGSSYQFAGSFYCRHQESP